MTSNESGVPSQEEIAKLPRRAIVAFAARCGLRVFPLFEKWTEKDEANSKYLKVVEKALRIAAHAAAFDLPSDAAYDVPSDAAFEATFVASTSSSAANAAAAAAFDAFAAAAAFDASIHVVSASASSSSSSAAAFAAAVNAAAAAKTDETDETVYRVVDSIRSDYEIFSKLAKKEGWDDDTPVPQSVFGIMWSRGIPETFLSDKGKAIEVTFEFPDSMSDEEIAEAVRQYHDTASLLHRAYGGSGLKLSGLRAEEGARVIKPQPILS